MKLSWWDRFCIGLAPQWGLRRVRSRAAAHALARSYEAGGGGRRAEHWRRTSTDANAALRSDLRALRELSRDLLRNNAWARRGVEVIVNNTVGWGIEAKADAASKALAKRSTDAWRRWALSAGCDFDGRLAFSGLQSLVMRTVVESGEAIIVRDLRASTDDATPVRVRVLEPDYLDETKDGIQRDGNAIVQGVEFDPSGRRVAYWLYEHHPGSTRLGLSAVSLRVPAESVLHVYRLERPGQVRGVPWLASAIARLKDFDEYEDAVLMQQKIAACFGAFVQDMDGLSPALGEQDASDSHIETLEPGHIQYLSPGKTVTFATPPSTSDTGGFSQVQLRAVAAALGITYEDLSGDYSQVNFSSARMGKLAHWANVDHWRWHMLIPQFCEPVWRWVMDVERGLQGWPRVPASEWSPPARPMLEPDKEGLAYQRLIRSGTMTLYQAIRELGYDPETHLREIAEANAKLDELGVWLDSDPRRTSAAGLTQERAGGGDSTDPSGDDTGVTDGD